MRSGRVIGCRIDETTLLIIGAGRVRAGDVVAAIGEDETDMRNAFVSQWRSTAALPLANHGFAAMLPTGITDGAMTTIRFGEAETGTRYIFAPRLISAEEAAALIVESAGSQAAAVINQLLDVLMAGNGNRRRLLTVIAFLQAVNASDGFIELMGENHDGVTFLQGWSGGMVPGPCRVCVAGKATQMTAECSVAVFPRADAPDGTSGFVGLFEASPAAHALDIEGMIFQGRTGWRHIAVHPRKRMIDKLETPEHLRSILMRSHGAPDVLLSLRAAANSFEGKETVSALPYPVRLGIDNALEGDGGHLLISGWLYDPEGHVAMVRLRRSNSTARLDEHWTRFDRPDVSDSFNDQQNSTSGFAAEHCAHGFMARASVSGEDQGSPLYFELTLHDSRRAFFPVKPARAPARLAALRQLGSIDPANPALPAIVDLQIVPFLRATKRSPPVIDTLVDAGGFVQDGSAPIVIGAGESEEDISPLLALLALDPETRRAPIVIAMSAGRVRVQGPRIRELARFYGLSVRLVSVKGAGDVYDMLEAGTQGLTCETVVCLSATLIPRAKGWYGKLLAAAATLKGSIISPVLAYEDHSIRWAGNWIDEANCDQPVIARYSGYPLKAVTGMNVTRIAAASLECCIMPRNVLLQAGSICGGYLGTQEKGLDLGLRLSRSGIEAYLLPSVQMWGCDDARGSDPAMAALVEEIDQKIFQSQWSHALTAEKHLEKRSA
jgi:hypothetical protein